MWPHFLRIRRGGGLFGKINMNNYGVVNDANHMAVKSANSSILRCSWKSLEFLGEISEV